MSSVVYFLRAGVRGPVKIGFTANLNGRLRALREGMPDKLHLEATIAGGRDLEQRIHRALHASRRLNEWFDATAEVNAVVSVARLKGLDPILRWLDRKEASVEMRSVAFQPSDDFEADIRWLAALAFKHAVARFGSATVAATVGRSVDAIEKYQSGKQEPPLTVFMALCILDPGAVIPFMSRCGEVPKWIQLEAARDAIDAQLRKLVSAA